MNEDKVDVSGIAEDAVAWTLLVTLYLRAWESRSPRSILGDHYAAEALERIDYDFARMKRKLRTDSNKYLVALRARQLDDWSAAFLAEHPDATVLQLGCGLDSRMLRLDPEGSLRWFDLDVPRVIDVRRRLYPERDRYRMIGASVTEAGWLDDIPADRPVLIIAEGLLPYLNATDVDRLLRRLTGHFRSGELIFDAFARWAVRMVKHFHWGPRDAGEIERAHPRLACAERVPLTANYRRIPDRRHRDMYRLIYAVPVLRNMYCQFRFTFPARTATTG